MNLNKILPYIFLLFPVLVCSSCTEDSEKALRSLFVKEVEKEAEAAPIDSQKTIVKVKRRKDGTLAGKIRYRNGKKNGVSENYYKNGNMRTSIEYKDDIRHGIARLYHKDGKLYRTTEYKNDKKDGTMTIYRKDGKVKATIPYKNDHPGIGVQEYYVSGNPKTEYPQLTINTIDRLASSNTYVVMAMLSEKGRNAVFYTGKLKDDRYFHDGMIQMQTPSQEVGMMSVQLPPGTSLDESINVVAVAETSMGNPYLIQKEVRINISN